jgi:predicted Ser/Thr protein kinase
VQLIPKYSSPNKKIRLMRMLNIGGFGVVWKARYKGQTVAIKLIRMDKYIGKGQEHEKKIQTAKMVVDEASIMGLMIQRHQRWDKLLSST